MHKLNQGLQLNNPWVCEVNLDMAKTKPDHQYHTESFFVHEEIIHDRVHVHDHKNKFKIVISGH